MSNFRYLVGAQNIIRKLQIPTNDLRIDMKKAHVSLLDTSGLEEKSISNRILDVEDDCTESGLQDQIAKLEVKTGRVCTEWSWLTKKSNAAKVSKEPFVPTDQYTAATM